MQIIGKNSGYPASVSAINGIKNRMLSHVHAYEHFCEQIWIPLGVSRGQARSDGSPTKSHAQAPLTESELRIVHLLPHLVDPDEFKAYDPTKDEYWRIKEEIPNPGLFFNIPQWIASDKQRTQLFEHIFSEDEDRENKTYLDYISELIVRADEAFVSFAVFFYFFFFIFIFLIKFNTSQQNNVDTNSNNALFFF